MEPWDGSGHGRWQRYHAEKPRRGHARCTCRHCRDLTSTELPLYQTAPFESPWTARVVDGRSECEFGHRPYVEREWERDREREIGREMAYENKGRRESGREGLKGAEGGGTGFLPEKMAPSTVERHRGKGRTRRELGSLYPHLIGHFFFRRETFPFLSSVLKEKPQINHSNYGILQHEVKISSI